METELSFFRLSLLYGDIVVLSVIDNMKRLMNPKLLRLKGELKYRPVTAAHALLLLSLKKPTVYYTVGFLLVRSNVALNKVAFSQQVSHQK